jgi:hypothetical protein
VKAFITNISAYRFWVGTGNTILRVPASNLIYLLRN